MTRLVVVLAATVVVLLTGSARAQQWDPFPALAPKSHVAVGRGVFPDEYQLLDDCLRKKASVVGATYFAAIVRVTDQHGRATPAGNDAVPYVDALYAAWQPTRRLDPDRHVLVVLGLDNRAVAIHPGARWVDLGFARQVITKTIDDSGFKTYARGGDYALAVCVLAQAVDEKLSALATAAANKKASLLADFDSLRAGTKQLEAGVDALGPGRQKIVALLRADLEQAREAIDAGVRDAGLERLASASAALARAREIADRVHQRMHDVAEANERLPELRKAIEDDIAGVEARTSPSATATREARAALTACTSRIAEIERSLEEGRLVSGAVEEVERCRQNAAIAVRQADRTWWIQTRFLPATAGVLLLAFAVFGIVTFRRRHLRYARDAREELSVWSQNLENASARLLELEQKHPIYFAPGAPRWEGDSAEMDREAADAVNLTFLLFAEAERLHREASDLVAGAGPLSSAPLARALELLRTTPVVFETGEKEKRRRIFLPLSERWEGTARTLLVALDQAYARALAALDRIAELRDACERRVDEGARAAADALEACSARIELGLSIDHLAPRLSEATGRQRAATKACLSDPKRAMAELDAAIPTLAEIVQTASLGNSVVEKARGPCVKEGKRLEEEVARLRAAGFRLDEPGLEIDRRLAQAGSELRHVEQLVADGSEVRASERLAAVERELATIAEQLVVTERARDEVPKAVAEIENAEALLVERVPDATARLERLASENAPDAFAAEADNLDELRTMLASLVRRRDHALAEHAAQRYLSTVAHVAKMREMLEAGDRLLGEIVTIERSLAEARSASHGLVEAVRRLGDRIDSAAPEGAPGPGEALRKRIREARVRAAELESRATAPKPNWTRLATALQAAHDELAALALEVDRENAALAEARAAARALEEELAGIDREVQREMRDRPHVSAAVAQVRRQLREWTAWFDDPSLSGTSCLEAVPDARRAIERVKDLWRTEVKLIRTIETELAAAEAEHGTLFIRKFSYGVTPRLKKAEKRLREARSALAAQRLDEALAHAQACRQAIAVERRRCEQEEMEREAADMRALEQRRRAASVWAASSSSSSSLFGSSSSSGLFGSSSSSSSFGFGSSSFDSSSGGSSFGSSSSGGSSFGDSSSGGSSW